MNAPQQRQTEEKFLDTIVGVFANPVPTLSGVVRRRSIANACIVIIVISIAQGLVQAISADVDASGEETTAWTQGFIILTSPIIGIGLTALFTGLCWVMSRMLGGSGEYGAMFAGLGFASAPYILLSLVVFLAIQLGSGAAAMIGIVQLGVIVWTIILGVIVVRESNQFSTGRASAAVLISAAVVFIVLVIVLSVVVLVSLGDDYLMGY